MCKKNKSKNQKGSFVLQFHFGTTQFIGKGAWRSAKKLSRETKGTKRYVCNVTARSTCGQTAETVIFYTGSLLDTNGIGKAISDEMHDVCNNYGVTVDIHRSYANVRLTQAL